VNIPAGFVGRLPELRILEARLAAARSGRPQVVYVEGEPGAGKSTLVAHFLGSVSNAVVLDAGGDEAESLLSYGVIDQLRLGTGTEPGLDPMVVGTQLLEIFDQPQAVGDVVVLAVDDLQWVDRPSLRALLFALRRLRADKVLTVVSARDGDLADPSWARFIAGDPRVTRIRLDGLTPADLTDLAGALGLGVLSERGASRLAAHTEGNALYCRALLEEIGVAGLSAPGKGGLRAPRELASVILARVAALPTSTQSFLAAASVLGRHATVSTVLAVAELHDAQDELDEAIGAGLLESGANGSELTFVHPLFRAAIYTDLSQRNRRRLHARAVDHVCGHAQLAHRVSASLGPDDELAAELESSARTASGVGDSAASAWALEQAAVLTAGVADRERRRLDAAAILLEAADSPSAQRVLSSCEVSSARRDALNGLLGVYTGSPTAEGRLLAAWENHDPLVEPEIGARAATSLANLMVISGRPQLGVTWAERAVGTTADGSSFRAMARTAQAYALGVAGHNPAALSVLDFLAAAGNEVPIPETDPLIMRGILRLYSDDLAGAIADLGVAFARVRTGLPSTYPIPCLVNLSDAHFRRGDWDAAFAHAQLATSLAQDADRPLDLARAHGQATQVLALRGQWASAQSHATAARAAADRFPVVFAVAYAAMAGAVMAAARGDLNGVLAATEAVRATERLDVGGRPGIFNWRAVEADALIGLGRLGEAGSALDAFEAAIPATGLASAALAVARCRGNLAAADGNAARAEEAFARAHELIPHVPMPFEHALVSFDDGRRLRMTGERAAAVDQLERAHHLFSGLGSDPYVERCAAELAGLAVPVATGSPATVLGLSRAELAVARLVATGLTNKEVAGQLYLSVKTVEYHLRNTYIKLDITSRRALMSLLA
jgi:DNA-binding CsgD family transcriptional regulator